MPKIRFTGRSDEGLYTGRYCWSGIWHWGGRGNPWSIGDGTSLNDAFRWAFKNVSNDDTVPREIVPYEHKDK